MKGRRSDVDHSLVEPGVQVPWYPIAQQYFHGVHTVSVISAAMPGLTAATAWAIQHSACAEALEANYLLQGRHRARVFRLFNTRTAGHCPLTTGPSGAFPSALLRGIVSRASGGDSMHVCVVRIHTRYRGTPPTFGHSE